MKTATRIPIKEFGKDHWSTFAYVETLCVDSIHKGVGTLDWKRLRVNEKSHPLHAINFQMTHVAWKRDFGTILRGYFRPNGKTDTRRRAPDHDDVDCLDDLEAEGLLEVVSMANGYVRMTEKGRRIAALLRDHKSRGGSFAGFELATA